MSLSTDMGAAVGMFLFTGAEALGEGSILEIISKFGVIAVLWFWLRDLKKEAIEQNARFDKRITELTTVFEDETDEIRVSYETIIQKLTDEYHAYTSKLEEMIKDQKEQTKDLHGKICEMYKDK